MKTTVRALGGVLTPFTRLLTIAALAIFTVTTAHAAVTVSITAPTNGAVFTAGSNITLSATASATGGYTISKVEFFHGGTNLIGTDTSSPYSITWNNVPAGSYTLTAKATAIKKNNPDQTQTSAPVSITVNALPSVSITSPSGGAVFAAPGSMTLTATASDSDGTISKVEFFHGGTNLIATVTSSPYTYNWTGVAAGGYSLTAKATDNNNGATTSSPVSVTVTNAPTVSLTSPTGGAVFNAPASVTLTATASDTDGIQKVEFFHGGTNLIATITSPPYTHNWTGVAAGSYSLTAKATDNLGIATTSAAVPITVNALPSVSMTSPSGGAVFAAPGSMTLTATASDTDGTISKVEFFHGGTNLIATVTTSPYTYNWTGVAAGGYSLTAVATDNQNATSTSSPVAVTVTNPPSVALTSPTNGANFSPPASITLTATASDADGIQKVEFFHGGTNLIATVTSSPYTYNWTNVGAGSYSLTAKATDNLGIPTTSSPVSITVSVSAPAGLYFIHPDHLNTPRAIYNDQQQLAWRWEQQEPFGNSPPNENPSGLGTFECNVRFPGQYFDKETNLAYNYFRDFDPALGRYVESDPIGIDAGSNTYAYVDDNPLSNYDPTGLFLTTTLNELTRGEHRIPPEDAMRISNLSSAVGVSGAAVAALPAVIVGGGEGSALICRAALPPVIKRIPAACKIPLLAAALGASICASSADGGKGTAGKPPGSARQYPRDRETIDKVGEAARQQQRQNVGGAQRPY